jgi:hypothetical protein
LLVQNYFHSLRDNNFYDKSNLADCIALLAIYMLIIRHETQVFVRLWNVHKIRKQLKRSNAIVDQSNMNYFYLEDHVQNFAITSSFDLLRTMQDDVKEWDIKFQVLLIRMKSYANQLIDVNEYLSSIIKNWCDSKLEEMRYDFSNMNVETTFSDESRQHCTIYTNLRQVVFEHIIHENMSQLSLCVTLWRGGGDSFRKFLKGQPLMWPCGEKRASTNRARAPKHEDMKIDDIR